MNPESKIESDIASIRSMMERTSKFISLSGLSGIMAGCYALAGAYMAYTVLRSYQMGLGQEEVIIKLCTIAIGVLVLSVATGLWLTMRKAKRVGANVWDHSAKHMFINLSIPLVAGGIFIIILLTQGHYEIIASSCLLFYGLALINASSNLYDEVRYLGYLEILLGLASAAVPGYGLFFWALGFGLLHIVYGALMFKRYDR